MTGVALETYGPLFYIVRVFVTVKLDDSAEGGELGYVTVRLGKVRSDK